MNYYCGHKPSTKYSTCWSDDISNALIFTLEQVRAIISVLRRGDIFIAAALKPTLTDEQFKHELFCAKGGSWYDYERVWLIRRLWPEIMPVARQALWALARQREGQDVV